MEYQGYGIYQSGQPSENQILTDADTLYIFLNKELGFAEKNIFVLGRSLGSGPATYLASRYRPGGLILISPFASIRNVTKDMFGFIGSLVIKERFDNLKKMSQVISPTLLIHGEKDKTVLPSHSEMLYGRNLLTFRGL